MGHAIFHSDSRQVKREVVSANCGSCLDRYVEHFLDKRVAAIKFQLWTTDAGSLSILVADVLAKHFDLDGIKIICIKQSFFLALKVLVRVAFAKLVGSEIQI